MGKVKTQTFWKKNGLPALLKRLELEQSKANVTIGIHEAEGEKEKTSNDDQPARLLLVEVATFHEFGTKHIPQRSFIRANDVANARKYRNIIEQIKDKVIFDNMTMERGLNLVGEVVRSDIQKRIRNGIDPKLEKSTIDRKGSSKPLIDTGQLINGITYVVKGVK